ncbi:MAG: serine hydrolase domain-containing protein [Thiogranum sp.]|nr:serine hydrolase domain-containing protein [Thiogranum sp.]
MFWVLSVCAFLVTNPVAAEPDQLLLQLERVKRQTGIGAVSYAMVENNQIVATGGMGQYGVDDARPVTATSLFRVGSITKTFTALAVMHLVEQGELHLDQPVKTVVPDLPLHNSWPETPVTLAMLLEHTAGLQDLTREEFDYPDPLSLQAALDIKSEARQLQWPPGYHYGYSNLGAGYVGRAIETVTREDYDSWFEREILTAIGMHDSQLHWTEEVERSLVTGYDADLKTEIPYWHTLFRPFGGLNTTAADMAKFLLLFTAEPYLREDIVSRSALKRMEVAETSLAAKAGLQIGYGLGIRNTWFNGHRIYGHGGDGDGYLAEFAYSKESRRAYFVVINAFRHDILDQFTGRMNHWLIEGLPENVNPAIRPAASPVSRKTLSALVGEYREVALRFPLRGDATAEMLRIRIAGGELFRCFSHARKCTKIVPVTGVLFRAEDELHASMAFIKAPDGNLHLQTGFDSYQKIREN